MSGTKLTLILCAASVLNICMSARILGIFPTPCVSHQLVYQRLMEELARRGHELVVLTTDGAIYNKLPNLTTIDAHNVSYDTFQSKYNFAASRSNIRSTLKAIKMIETYVIDAQLNLPQMQAILANENEHFDVIFVEILYQYLAQLSVRFSAPFIGICSLSAGVISFDALGNPSQPLLYRDNFVRYIGEQNLWQKLDTVYSYIYHKYLELFADEGHETLMQKHFGVNMATANAAGEQMSLLSLNIYPIFGGVRPTVPALVYLGGLHLRPKKQLPKDLQTFLDGSPQGVVYLSFGSNVKTTALPSNKIEILLNVFRQLPFNVVLKWENDTLAGKPANVHTSKWLPQQDMLGHQNVKAFVSQCGQQSLEESIHSGVPVLCVPFLGDQFMNCQLVVKFGIGRGYDFTLLEEASFKEALVNVTETKGYGANIKRLSALLQDQKWTPLERASWWTEYVLRHKGAPHLRAAPVSLHEYLMIDIAGLVMTLVLGACFVSYMIIKLFKSLLRRLLS